MQDLKIGQSVMVSAVTSVGYGLTNERRAFRDKVVMEAVITGRRIKYLGILKTFPGSSLFMEPSDPSELKVTGSLELWEVRTGMLNNPLLVADGDLKPCDNFTLPRMYRRS